MKVPQTAVEETKAEASAATDHDDNHNLQSMKKAYKRARDAYKEDKSNKELKKRKSEAKKALALAEENCSSTEITSSRGDCKEKELNPPDESHRNNIKLLEEKYQQALTAFKSDKSDKDLRRAKTAARRALDAYRAANTEGTQLVCLHCSKKFIFTTEEQDRYKALGWTDSPKRCDACKKSTRVGLSSLDRRSKLDSKKRNMCYAFQRGECPHGENCKFSHNPDHGGKRSGAAAVAEQEKKEGGTDITDNDNTLQEGKESKERKEQSLRKNKEKGWRNK